ncbi:MAG TPA: TIM barrel protein [Candidatus Dormibacteraeota bacterium]|nr:TIM barrel protein [Candidatus Dormibacteraeota bacterium]
MTSNLRLGVTLYSFTPEFHSHRYDLEQLVEEVGQRGLGPGLEIVGYQSIKGFPKVSDEFADRFRGLLERNRLAPSCLGGNVDIGIRSDRMLTQEELRAAVEAQIVAARRLGFPVLRLQYSATPDLLEELLPVAEREDVRLGVEIHAPHSVAHPTIQRLRERFERLGSPYLGFVPDFGASTTGIPKVFLDGYRRRGVSEEVVATVVDAWQEARLQRKDPFQVRKRLSERVEAMGGAAYDVALAWHAFEYFGHQAPGDWLEIMPRVVHVHAKFFEIEGGVEPSVPYPDLLRVFSEGGYGGHLSSEYEGWQWDERPEGLADGLAMVEAHQRLCRGVLARLGPR